MLKFEEVAEKILWAGGTVVVLGLVLNIVWVILSDQDPELLEHDPITTREAKRKVSMPSLGNIKLVLDRNELRNPGDRIKNTLKECIGRPPALIGTGGTAKIEAFLADASETDIFYFHCSSRESWEGLAGRAGFVRVRDGKPVDELILYMN